MNSLELRSSQTLFNHSQRLGCKQPLFRSDNPNQFPFRLKGQDVVRIQENIFLPASAYDLSTPEGIGRFRGGGNFVETRRDLTLLALQVSSSLHGSSQSRLANRLQQIIYRSCLECFDGVLVKGGNNHDDGERRFAEVPNYLEPAHDRHLEIEKDKIRPKLCNLLQRFFTVASLANDQNLREESQLFAKDAPGDRLIVNNYGFHHARVHLLELS